MTLRDTIEERIYNAYAAGHNDGSMGKERDVPEYVQAETARILEAVERYMLTKEGMTMSTLLGYEAGVAAKGESDGVH